MVKIIQLLCPLRHSICGSAFEEDTSCFVDACNALEEIVRPRGPLKRQCMICGSRDLHFEEAPTRFKTLEEAMPHLAALQMKNILARRVLDAEGKTLEKGL